jgi:hypothetical protein
MPPDKLGKSYGQKEGIMQRVILNTEGVETVTWPNRCCACGRGIEEHDETPHTVKVEKSLKAQFIRSKQKTITVMLCMKCSRKVSNAKRLENFGWGLAGLTFLSAIFFGRSQELIMGAAGLFWLGAILGWLGGRRHKRTVGVRCMRRSKDIWAFWLMNKDFATDFARLNSQLAQKE